MLVLPSFPPEGRLCVVCGPTLITSHQPLASQGDHFTPAIVGTLCCSYKKHSPSAPSSCCSAAVLQVSGDLLLWFSAKLCTGKPGA